MASALSEDDMLICRICLGQYKNPRKLPCCEHSFCELCIVNHFTSSGHGESKNNKLACPLCRTYINPKDQDSVVIDDWIRSFPTDGELLSRLEAQRILSEADSERDSEADKITTRNVCCLCKELGKVSKSSSFCIECQENLCSACSDIHRVSKLSRHHNLVEKADTLDGYKHGTNITLLLSKHINCSEHAGKLLEFYCKDDDVLLCITCLLRHHTNCDSVLELNQSQQSTKCSAERKIDSLKDSHLRLSTFAQAVLETVKENQNSEQRQQTEINARLQEIRSSIIHMLDSLEHNILHQRNVIMKQNQFQRSELKDQVRSTLGHLDVNLALIENVLATVSESYTFVILHKLKGEFQVHENHVLELCGAYKPNDLDLTESDLLTTLLSEGINETDKLVKIEPRRAEIVFPKYKEKVVGNCYAVEKVETKVIKGNQNVFYGPLYTSLLQVTNKNLLLIDNRFGHCYLTDEKDDVVASRNFMPNREDEVDFKRTPFSATNLHDGTIAVTVPEDRKVYIVNAENLSKLAHIVTKYKARALHGLKNGDIAVAWDEPVAFGIISFMRNFSYWQPPDKLGVTEKTYFTKDRNGRLLNQFDYMAVDENRSHVIQSCQDDAAVYCFDFEGNTIFCYRNPNIFQPQGVAIDSNGVIYVCESTNCSIHVVSPNGMSLNVIKEGCPVRPLAIAFDSKGENFAVSNSGVGFAGRDIVFYRIVKK